MRLPQQCEDIQHDIEEQRVASAPYNFVPLPDKVVAILSGDELRRCGEEAAASAANEDEASRLAREARRKLIDERLPSHDALIAGRYSGYFDVTLTTLTPLFIRGPIPLDEFERQERGADIKDKQERQTPFIQHVKNRPEFFYVDPETKRPVIPGSSLRGMLRSLVEIIAYSKVQWVTKKRLFCRAVGADRVGRHYVDRMVAISPACHPAGGPFAAPLYTPKVRGGFFMWKADGSGEIEECDVARIEISEVLSAAGFTPEEEHRLYELQGTARTAPSGNPNQTPSWAYQHRQIWVQVEAVKAHPFRAAPPRHDDLYLQFARAHDVAFSPSAPTTAHREGILVLTGRMQHKHMAFVFLKRSAHCSMVQVPNRPDPHDPNAAVLDRFHDDDQITPWQERAFPRDKPTSNCRRAPGALRNGEPVFFLAEPDNPNQVQFLGRAQMFRLPYEHSPHDLIPEQLRSPADVDYAEALFGFVRGSRQELEAIAAVSGGEVPLQGSKLRAYAGRVRVTDAVLEGDTEGSTAAAFTPHILASPKPTSFQHYLVQTDTRKDELRSFDDPTPEETVARGHKLYWHQGKREIGDLKAESQFQDPYKKSTQHTRMSPVHSGRRFTFQVFFENLTEEELGTLCWALHPVGDPEKRYRHSLGMGKPLGMGAIELDVTLHVTKRPDTRYRTLFAQGGSAWATGMEVASSHHLDEETTHRLTEAFERAVIEDIQKSSPIVPAPAQQRLCELKRIALLLKLMEWDEQERAPQGPPHPSNRYLRAKNRPNTRYMSIKLEGEGLDPADRNEYRKRPVLPPSSAFGPLTGYGVPMSDGEPVGGLTDGGAMPPLSALLAPSQGVTAAQGSGNPPQQQTPRVARTAEPVVTSHRETVTVTSAVTAKGKAIVLCEDGSEVECSGIPTYLGIGVGSRLKVTLTRIGGLPQGRAKYHSRA